MLLYEISSSDNETRAFSDQSILQDVKKYKPNVITQVIITLADPPLTDRPGNTGGLLSIAVNEGWRITVLEIT